MSSTVTVTELPTDGSGTRALPPAERYELLERIGAGGMAEVFRARLHSAAGIVRTVAAKRMLPDLAGHPWYRDMLAEEARIGAHLIHANIVQIIELQRIQGELYLVMEHVDGSDLHRVLHAAATQARVFPLACALHLAIEILEGLHFAHTRRSPDGLPHGIVHRDVSPANILLSHEGEVRIVDFGIAAARERRKSARVGGYIKGKPRYMSPEQIRNGEVDARADVYAVGMVLLTLASGRDPFEGASQEQILERIARQDLPKCEIHPSMPAGLDRILARALAADPADRWADAAEFRAALEDYAYENGFRLGKPVLAAFLRNLLRTPEPVSPAHDAPEQADRDAGTIESGTGPAAAVHFDLARRADPDPEGAAPEPSLLEPEPAEPAHLEPWKIALAIAACVAAFGTGTLLAAGL